MIFLGSLSDDTNVGIALCSEGCQRRFHFRSVGVGAESDLIQTTRFEQRGTDPSRHRLRPIFRRKRRHADKIRTAARRQGRAGRRRRRPIIAAPQPVERVTADERIKAGAFGRTNLANPDHARAMPDHVPHRRRRHAGASQHPQCMVKRGAQIGRRIDKRAVEIENHGGGKIFHHASMGGRRCGTQCF